MNKKIKILIVISLFIIILILIMIGGVSLSTNKFVFSTRYYKTPRKAFEKENSAIAIQDDIYLYDLNEYNSFYVGLTEENELIICQMFCKNKRYFYTGNYVIYNLDNTNLSLDDNYNENNIFNKKGIFEEKIFWKLLISEDRIVDYESSLIYNDQIDNKHYYVYFIIK